MIRRVEVYKEQNNNKNIDLIGSVETQDSNNIKSPMKPKNIIYVILIWFFFHRTITII